jgi:TolB protein
VVGGSAADIWTVDLESGDLQQITTWPGTDTHPDWSHDGDKIAYRSVRDDHDALYVFSFTTGLHVRLTTLESSLPDWSPDDARIVCERNALPGGADILIVDYPSGVEHPLFGQQNLLRYPRWHPLRNELILISSDQRGGPAVMIFALPSGPLQNMVCCLDDAAFSAWGLQGWFSLTDVGNLLVCTEATAVSPATWGAVKARLLPGQPDRLPPTF